MHRIGIGSEHDFPSLHTVKRHVDRSSKNPIEVQGGLRLQSGVRLHDSSIEVQSDLMLHKSWIEVPSDLMLHNHIMKIVEVARCKFGSDRQEAKQEHAWKSIASTEQLQEATQEHSWQSIASTEQRQSEHLASADTASRSCRRFKELCGASCRQCKRQ